MVVERRVILELKVVRRISPADYARTRSCLAAAKLDVALLVNFYTERADFRRVTLRK